MEAEGRKEKKNRLCRSEMTRSSEMERWKAGRERKTRVEEKGSSHVHTVI